MAGCSLSPASPDPVPPDLQSMTPAPDGPAPRCEAQQPGLVCSSDGFCWANPRPQLDELTAVWALSPTDVWVAASAGAVLHLDGSRWQSTTATVGLTIRGLWASAASSVWAVGDQGAIRRWDGQSWRTVASGTTAGLLAVWGSGPSDVWAVGEGGTILTGNYAPRTRTYSDARLQVSGKLRRHPTCCCRLVSRQTSGRPGWSAERPRRGDSQAAHRSPRIPLYQHEPQGAMKNPILGSAQKPTRFRRRYRI